MSIIVSVIIPAYNVELYIKECLDSILSQSLKDIEIIVVDDGSTDDTIQIVQDYAAFWSNIRLISQRNCGQSSARNRGLSVAVGKYIVFIDSDDWLPSNSVLDKMVKRISLTDADYVQGSFEYVNGKKHTSYKVSDECEIFGKSILEKTIKCQDLYTSPWAKIYKKEFLLSNNLFFIEGLVNEDTAHSIMIALKAKKVSLIQEVIYSSRERDGSTSRNDFQRMFKSMHKIFNITRKYLQQNGEYKGDIIKLFEGRYKRSMLYNLLQSAQRNRYTQFNLDWLYCVRYTDYLVEWKSEYSSSMPLPNRVLYHISKHPRSFFVIFRLLNKLGIKMH